MNINVQKLNDKAVIPNFATEGAAGFDLVTTEGGTLAPGERRLFGTGIAYEIPVGLELQIRPRSGLAYKHGITVLNTPGTIDSDFRGEVKVLLINHGEQGFAIFEGDRIAQGVIAEYKKITFNESEELSETIRGAGGFGHTGTNV